MHDKTIYKCGYCDKELHERLVRSHLKRVHNVQNAEVSEVRTEVIML